MTNGMQKTHNFWTKYPLSKNTHSPKIYRYVNREFNHIYYRCPYCTGCSNCKLKNGQESMDIRMTTVTNNV